MRGICRHCEAPIHFAAQLRTPQWVHDRPLAELRVTETEAGKVMADKGLDYRQRHFDNIHQPEPNRQLGVF